MAATTCLRVVAVLAVLGAIGCADRPEPAPQATRQAVDHPAAAASGTTPCEADVARFPVLEPVPHLVEGLRHQLSEDRAILRVSLGGPASPTSVDRWVSISVQPGPPGGPGSPTTVRTPSGRHPAVVSTRSGLGIDGDEDHVSQVLHWSEGDVAVSVVSLDAEPTEVDEILGSLRVVPRATFLRFRRRHEVEGASC